MSRNDDAIPHGIGIRPALKGERKYLIELQRRASLSNAGDRVALLAHPEAIDVPARHIEEDAVRVAEMDGAIAGFSVVLRREDGDAELDGLFVEPDVWKSGVGRALVEEAAARALKSGAKALHVIGNPHAEGFYEALGFVTYGQFETRFGPGLRMQRSCRPS
jgi:GNAT superfamily N-acetyltransferase